MSFVTSGFKKLVHSLSIGKTGYGIVVSGKGTFLSHPINDYIGTTNQSTVMESDGNSALVSAYEALLNGETGNVEYEREVGTGNKSFTTINLPPRIEVSDCCSQKMSYSVALPR